VLATGPTFDAASARTLTASPVSSAGYSVPVEFGHQSCFAVRALVGAPGATLESAPSAVTCITPVDDPPPAPTGLQVSQQAGAVVLSWSPVRVPDLSGYIVLRGEGSGEMLQPLVRDPIAETTYRDATARAGLTYVYVVVAIDKASQVSPQSTRESLAVR
jgi:fibronectin type 3 domain-containing protein